MPEMSGHVCNQSQKPLEPCFFVAVEIAERSCSKESSATCSFECKDVSKAIRARTRIEYQEGCVVEGVWSCIHP